MQRILCSAVLFSCFATSPVLAENTEDAPPPVSEALEWRVDFHGPTIGIGAFLAPTVNYTQGILTFGGEVRLAHASGNGALVRVAHGTNLWGGGTAVDLAYLHRLDFVGNARNGGSIDFELGPSFAWLSHNQGDVPMGSVLGGQVGLAVQGRAENFSGFFGGQVHGYLPLEGAPNGGPTGFEMALTVMGGFGFGFYG